MIHRFGVVDRMAEIVYTVSTQ